jgi:hypothetical protein
MDGRLWKVRFEVLPWAGGPHRELLPIVDDVSLVDRVSEYEHAASYDVAGGYAGLVIENFPYGDLTTYLTAGRAALLGCDCGELGCWSLEAAVQVDEDVVVWDLFTQPHRPARDYTGFGPFRFRRPQYEQAVRRLVSGLD